MKMRKKSAIDHEPSMATSKPFGAVPWTVLIDSKLSQDPEGPAANDHWVVLTTESDPTRTTHLVDELQHAGIPFRILSHAKFCDGRIFQRRGQRVLWVQAINLHQSVSLLEYVNKGYAQVV